MRCVDAKINWCQIDTSCSSSGLVVNWFWSPFDFRFACPSLLQIQVIWMSNDLRFRWFGCQVIWDSNGLDVNWFEIQMIWLSTDLKFKWLGYQLKSSDLRFIDSDLVFTIHLRFKWCGCRLIGNSTDWVVEWSEFSELVAIGFESEMIWLSSDLNFKWFGYQLIIWKSNDTAVRTSEC